MIFVLGIALGAGGMAALAAAMVDFGQVKDIPAWVQAVGSVLAIFSAIGIAWSETRRSESARRDDRSQRVRAVCVALSAELKSMNDAMRDNYTAGKELMRRVICRLVAGQTIDAGSAPTALRIFKPIVFSSLANQLGELPPALVRELVQHYTFLRSVEDMALGCATYLDRVRILQGFYPRLRFECIILVRKIEKYLADESLGTKPIHLSFEELEAIAMDVEFYLAREGAHGGDI